MKRYSELKEKRQCLKEVIPLEKPFSLLFEPASICNFKCVQCFQSVKDVEKVMPRGQMNFEDLTKMIDDLKKWKGSKIKVIRIIGFGEPFVNKNTAKMVSYIKKSDISERLEITSNGSLLTEEVAEELVEAGLDYIRISIYSALQDRHEEITQNNIDIKNIYNNIKVLQEIKKKKNKDKPFVYIKMLDSFNENENKAFFDMYSDVADEIALEKPHNWLDVQEKNFINDLYGDDINVNEKGTIKKVCPQPFKMMSIKFNGDVIVCDPDWMCNTKVGNALENTLENIWHSKEMKEFWKIQIEGRRYENESCKRCTFINDNYTLDNIDGISIDKIKEW